MADLTDAETMNQFNAWKEEVSGEIMLKVNTRLAELTRPTTPCKGFASHAAELADIDRRLRTLERRNRFPGSWLRRIRGR